MHAPVSPAESYLPIATEVILSPRVLLVLGILSLGLHWASYKNILVVQRAHMNTPRQIQQTLLISDTCINDPSVRVRVHVREACKLA